MIVAARRRAPRAQNYRSGIGGTFSRGHLPGMGDFTPPAVPNYQDPGYPPDPAIVAANNVLNAAYGAAMQQAQVSNNYDQCAANAQNATSQDQYDQVMASCGGQAAIQAAPMAGDLPTEAARTVPNVDPVIPTVTPAPWSGLPATPAWSSASQISSVTPATVTPSVAPAVTPAGQVVVTSSGAQTAPGATPTPVASSTGFDLSTIPWWGWAIGAGVALFAMRGK